MNNILHSSESNEWYTPPEVVDLVETIFGDCIHLDPASNLRANQIVKARRFFSKAQDGLNQDWSQYQNIFNNPPYGRGTGKWIDKALASTPPTIMLLNATPGRQWFAKLIDSDQLSWLYFFRKRIRFLDPVNLEPQTSPTHDNVLIGVRTPVDCQEVFRFVENHESDRLGGWFVLPDEGVVTWHD